MMGIDISDDINLVPQLDESNFETNTKGVYLAGVVCKGMNTCKYFIENSINHAVNIFDHIQSTKE